MLSLHITHSSAGPERLQGLFAAMDGRMRHLERTLPGCVVLRTCNRFEIYADDEGARDGMEALAASLDDPGAVFMLEGEDSIRHLFRVAAGLDSMIVGEDQIQGQVRDAYRRCRSEGRVPDTLARIFDAALSAGKRVRSETLLNKGAVSVGSAAVELAERRLGPLKGRTATVIGAGEMASVISKNLLDKGLETIFVSNRTFSNALRLAERLGGKAVRREETEDAIRVSDLVIVATSAPHVILRTPTVRRAVEGRTEGLLIIDVSVPRNISCGISGIDNVRVESMEGLQGIASENARRRSGEVRKAETIIEEEVSRISGELGERDADTLIREINRKVSAIREQELRKAMVRAEHSDIDQVFDDFSRALVSRILAHTYVRLKEASREGDTGICAAASDLFGLEGTE